MQDIKLNRQDEEVLNFLSKYKMIKVSDTSLIYKTKRYYRQRINKLINNNYVKRYKSYIILDKKGRKFLGKEGTSYIKNISNEAYMQRLRSIADIATITIYSDIKFIPSWNIKDKNIYTETARRYIGKIILDNKEYLTYYLSPKKVHVYIKQMLFDINKLLDNAEIIIFVENFDNLSKKYSNLSFGKKNTFVILNNSENKNVLKNYKKINVHELLENIYNCEVMISDWDKADFYLENNKYIMFMPFINTEKIENINWYYSQYEDSKRKVDIITLKENEEALKRILNNKCNIKYIDKNLLGGNNEKQEE